MTEHTPEGIIDFHTHTLLSDGMLIPVEHVRRAYVAGYRVLGITDHVDAATLPYVCERMLVFREETQPHMPEILIIPGVELTHVPPTQIADLTEKARRMGVPLVVVHGETRAEPVKEGTNRAAIEAGVDILAHPGFLSDDDAKRAKEMNVAIEITHKKGHSITNGHVANVATAHGATIVVNSDAHAPEDFLSIERQRNAVCGAGLSEKTFQSVLANNMTLAKALLARLEGRVSV